MSRSGLAPAAAVVLGLAILGLALGWCWTAAVLP